MITNPKIIAELKTLSQQNGGLLLPESVVDAARPKSSPLHSQFEWDNGKAAEQYRIQQARQLLRVVVEWIPTDKGRITQNVFVSLVSDRGGGGYRQTVSVMSQKDKRTELLQDALSELNRVRQKYAELQELATVFEALASIENAA